MKKHVIHKSTTIYNNLQYDIKTKSYKIFSKQLKILIQSDNMWNVGEVKINQKNTKR